MKIIKEEVQRCFFICMTWSGIMQKNSDNTAPDRLRIDLNFGLENNQSQKFRGEEKF